MTRNRRRLTIALAAAVLAVVALRSFVAVDETRYVLVTDFGRIGAVHNDQPGESGLRFKWPWQSTLEIDRRLQVFDTPSREVITGDKRNLEVESYVVWRVRDPARFVRSVGTKEAAQGRLGERVAATLSDAIGRRDLSAFASTDGKAWGLDALTEEVLATVATRAREELGVEVVDVRLRRFNFPVEVRPAVFDLIRSERKQVATALRAEGEARYQTIVSQADRQRDTILAQAEAEAERLAGQAEAEAMRVANEAHARDPHFFEFLRTLDTYRSVLDDKATIVLSSSSPLLRLLNDGPSDEVMQGPRPSPLAPTSRPSPAGARP